MAKSMRNVCNANCFINFLQDRIAAEAKKTERKNYVRVLNKQMKLRQKAAMDKTAADIKTRESVKA